MPPEAAEVSKFRGLKKSFRSNRPPLIDSLDQSCFYSGAGGLESGRSPPPCQRACSRCRAWEHSINIRWLRPVSPRPAAVSEAASRAARVGSVPGHCRAQTVPLPDADRAVAGPGTVELRAGDRGSAHRCGSKAAYGSRGGAEGLCARTWRSDALSGGAGGGAGSGSREGVKARRREGAEHLPSRSDLSPPKAAPAQLSELRPAAGRGAAPSRLRAFA